VFGLKKIDWYIIKKFLGTFCYALSLIILIVIVFDIAEKIDDFLDSEATTHEIVFDYYFNFIPYFANLFSPLFIFISVIFFTSKMASNSEIIAILNSGMSFKRMLLPYFLVATLLAFGTYYLSSWVIPKTNKARLAFEDTHIRSPFVNRDRHIHRQISPGTFIYMEKYNSKYDIGYSFSMERFKDGELVYKLLAKDIRWQKDTEMWAIKNYTIRYIDGLDERIERGARIDTVLNIFPKDFEHSRFEMTSMNNSELDDFIISEEKRGAGNLEGYLIEKYRRYAFPFATFILTLIGVSLSSRKVKGGIGMHLGIGIASCFAYILFFQISTTFSINAGLSPLISVWIPNIVFSIYALYLYKLAPK